MASPKSEYFHVNIIPDGSVTASYLGTTDVLPTRDSWPVLLANYGSKIFKNKLLLSIVYIPSSKFKYIVKNGIPFLN